MIEASQFNMGISGFTGSKPAFINFTLDTLTKGYPEMIAPDEVVVEILETVKPGKKITGNLQKVARRRLHNCIR
jgi:EAL and modified HD-GYP domain-containing signal transduction protein